jgi:hypothetical protein
VSLEMRWGIGNELRMRSDRYQAVLEVNGRLNRRSETDYLKRNGGIHRLGTKMYCSFICHEQGSTPIRTGVPLNTTGRKDGARVRSNRYRAILGCFEP